MLRLSLSICTLFSLLVFLSSCSSEETILPPIPSPIINTTKVKKIIYTDYFGDITITLDFQYKQENVYIVNWNLLHSSGVGYSYREERFYSATGELDSLKGNRSSVNGGQWDLHYTYQNGLRYKIESKRTDPSIVATFAEHKSGMPKRAENLYGIYGHIFFPSCTTFEFDAVGNLVNQQNTCFPGFPDENSVTHTSYSEEINPLHNLIETPLPQGLEFYDDLAFYYSVNLPSSVEANHPFVDPIHNKTSFIYDKDVSGRVIQIKAVRHDNATRFVFDITYY